MGRFYQVDGSMMIQRGDAETNATGITIAAPGSADTKSGWTATDAGAPFDCAGLMFHGYNPAGNDCLLDIAVGAASSEQVIMENLYVASSNATDPGYFSIWVPLFVPKDARISVRGQTNATGGTMVEMDVAMIEAGGWAGGPSAFGYSDTYGADTANSKGTTADPGGSANTWGSWAQLVASTTRDINMYYVCAGVDANNVTSSHEGRVGVGFGSASNEEWLMEGQHSFISSGADRASGMILGPYWGFIPAGSRLVGRAMSANTSAGNRERDLVVIGFGG